MIRANNKTDGHKHVDSKNSCAYFVLWKTVNVCLPSRKWIVCIVELRESFQQKFLQFSYTIAKSTNGRSNNFTQ